MEDEIVQTYRMGKELESGALDDSTAKRYALFLLAHIRKQEREIMAQPEVIDNGLLRWCLERTLKDHLNVLSHCKEAWLK